MKSKALAILLFFCFFAPVGTTFLFLHFQKKQIKKEVKSKIIAGMNKNELLLLKFTTKEKHSLLIWKHSKEFEYKGKMYDIVESNTIGNTTYYWVYGDHEETKINKKIDQLISVQLDNNSKKQENQERLQSFLKSLYFSSDIYTPPLVVCYTKNKNHFGLQFYRSIFRAPPFHPPQKKILYYHLPPSTI